MMDPVRFAKTTARRLWRIWRVGDEVTGLRHRIESLEHRIADAHHIAGQLRDLARRVDGERPNGNYFNERFRDYELLVSNVKTLGYELGRALSGRQPTQPPVAGPLAGTLTSHLCLQRDMESDWLRFWTQEIQAIVVFHRKLWEHCFIAQAMFDGGMLTEGKRGLGFGCGEEPLPSLFAKYGAKILVTDLPREEASAKGWADTSQHSQSLEMIRRPDICPDTDRLARIDLRYVDMNAIPDELHGQFDFCWSACALEHLGSIALGLAFIENSLKTLRPGGVAVHTFEFNLSDHPVTIDNWPTVLFQRQHVEALAEKLTRAGYRVAPLNFETGGGVLDNFVDIPPWRSDVVALTEQWAQLKLSVDGFACTSFGIIVQLPDAS